MKLVTRADLGWPASAAPLQATTRGVKIHYEGTPVSRGLLADHGACLREWQAIRASHLANKQENYSDIAYSFGACPHGYLLEGRGLGRRTGANGSQPLNAAHYAVVGLVGDSGLTEPTPEMLAAIRDGIELLQAHGAGPEIRGHRDGYATDCPGPALYAWVQRGAPRPTTTTSPAPAPAPAPVQEDDMPTIDEIRAVIRQEVNAAIDARKPDLTHDVLYWTRQATQGALGQPMEDNPHPVRWVAGQLAEDLRALASGGPAVEQIGDEFERRLADGIAINGTITTKGN
ncbi:peptidoglycan recognition family protein [Kitasatospora sp. NPDC057692]|uniref:peptidoglycan recognition protein family protein n=1 Tax=Kitasatospora sp. NPDC057692 TaxID=3346215 RepID=UPI00368D50A9